MDIESSLIPKIAVGLVSLYALKRRLAKRKTDRESKSHILPGKLLMGKINGLVVYAPLDGKYIYGVPGHAKRVLKITAATGEYELIGPEYKGPFKWLRGVEVPASVTGSCRPYTVCQVTVANMVFLKRFCQTVIS